VKVEIYRLSVSAINPSQWVVHGHPAYPDGLLGPGNPQGRGGRKTPLVSHLAVLASADEVAKAIEWVGRFRVVPPDLDDHRFRVVGGGHKGRDLFIGGKWSGLEDSLACRRVRPLVPALVACETLDSAQNLLDLETKPA
jgi:hypothetical protein